MPCHNAERVPHMDRKAKKPLMEKRRRARINKCLGDLKSLLLEHLKRDPSQTSKLEKADILEMTVHLLRRMQHDQLMRATSIQPSIRDRFLEGWRDCASQVGHYANSVDGMPPSMRDSLQRHLTDRYRALQQTLPTPPPPMMNFPTPTPTSDNSRNRLPPMPMPGPGSVFPPASIMLPGHSRAAHPQLFTAALTHPSAFAAAAAVAAAQQWRANMIRTTTQSQSQSTNFETTSDTLIKRELQKMSNFGDSSLTPSTSEGVGERSSISSASTNRMLASTPECYDEEEEDDDDSASCSSSEATNESEPNEHHHSGVKDHVWRPW